MILKGIEAFKDKKKGKYTRKYIKELISSSNE